MTLTLTLTFIFIICLGFGINKRYIFLFNHISFFLTIFSYTLQKLFKLVKNSLFLHFESRHFMTLTLTFTFIFIICLGLVSIKDTLFYITILVLFLPSSATFHKKGFKLVKNPLFLHFDSRQFMTLTMTFIHPFLQPV